MDSIHERPLPGLRPSPIGKLLVKNLGLPNPDPAGALHRGRTRSSTGTVARRRHAAGSAESLPACSTASASPHATTADAEGRRTRAWSSTRPASPTPPSCVALQRVLHPPDAPPRQLPPRRRARHAARAGRRPPSGSPSARSRASPGRLGKEIGRGGTVQLVYVAPGAEDAVDSTLAFLLSPKSAYVSGQVVRIGATGATDGRPGRRLDPAAGRQGRAGHRRQPRHRRADRPRAAPRRRDRRRRRRAPGRRASCRP